MVASKIQGFTCLYLPRPWTISTCPSANCVCMCLCVCMCVCGGGFEERNSGTHASTMSTSPIQPLSLSSLILGPMNFHCVMYGDVRFLLHRLRFLIKQILETQYAGGMHRESWFSMMGSDLVCLFPVLDFLSHPNLTPARLR